jgi:hypothetical protein
MPTMTGKAASAFGFLLISIPSCLGSAWDPTANICTLDSHCLNEGKCIQGNEWTNYSHCQCQEGFSGSRCSKFCPFDCKNGGYCTVTPEGEMTGLDELSPGGTYDPADYMCECYGRFTGIFCETPYTRCGDAERCYNGGLCLVAKDMMHECSCPPGFGGDSCELPLETTDSKVTEAEKVTVMVVSILLLFLGITALGMILKTPKTPKTPPKFILVEQEPEDGHASVGKDDGGHICGHLLLNVV